MSRVCESCVSVIFDNSQFATGELQGAENPGVDARHQLALLGDVLARREVDAKRTILMTIDIAKAFPWASRPLLFAVLRARGLGGSLLRAVVARTGARAIAPGLQPGVDGRRGSIDLGLFEGAHASPRYFVLIIGTLIARLRALTDSEGRPVGVRVGGKRRGGDGRAGAPGGDELCDVVMGLYVGSLGFMDDVAALIEEIEHAPLVLKETRRCARWARSLLADEKTTVTATRLGDDDLPAVSRYVAGVTTTRTATWLMVRSTSDAAEGFRAHGVARAAVAREYVKRLNELANRTFDTAGGRLSVGGVLVVDGVNRHPRPPR